ncbi:MAG: Helicase associated domain protein [Clostridia bacterium]|nr:Helicase associated domain protein [Clostridia bacterium]
MGIQLFSHNQIAYRSALEMLSSCGKAAVVHPTGTGKSFIGFKLCEDHPNAVVCWLAPSEYIFKTQTENWEKAGGSKLENIRFYTYAKLMLLSREELKEINSAYIVLDEFHRCGAEMWGAGVQRLLDLSPTAKILGLSATAIRYLDNQRNMADELFDNNVASEMTLGEAIVRGILNPPKYVLSVYSFQKDLEKYKTRIKKSKSKAVFDESEKYYELLRRALQQADGLDVVFDKHMQDRRGKYIAFCANVEHMREMIEKSSEWFALVDKNAHIYCAYSDNPETSKEFDSFKKDESEHLKLLFCIDMLNEGVHVDDVSGVILFRPTVSPIIYKQQIGRALSASKSKMPVIFDIVNNIENLYSIGTIEEEVALAVSYYRERGLEKQIVNEKFEIKDELRDCRALFERLNESLTASWELMYLQAKKYYQQNGNLEVSKRYKTPDGYSLGGWIFTQRKVRSGEQYGNLDEVRIRKLDEIGMIWDSVRDLAWEKYFFEAKSYYEKYGDLKVPARYTTPTGVKLGAWINNLRTYRKSGIQKNYLTQKRIEDLEQIGMLWTVPDYLWEKNYVAALEFYREHGHLDVPLGYVSAGGIKLGNWIRKLRGLRKGSAIGAELTCSQIARLDEIGMIWANKFERQWETGFSEAKTYFERYGDLNVPTGYITDAGYKLGGWIVDQRANKKLAPSRRKRLDEIGMIWGKPDSWETRFDLAREFYLSHGNLNVPTNYIVQGVWLNKWVNEQKQIYKGNRAGKYLTGEQIAKLETVGMKW